jgi:hypothetical protein
MDADTIIIMDAADATDLEIGAALTVLRQDRLSRIQQATSEIPIKYAEIKAIEGVIALFKKDREWCKESLKTLDHRIAELEAS